MGKGDQRWRLPITLGLAILGVVLMLLGVGLLIAEGARTQYVIVTGVGLVLVCYFAPQAAGARKTNVEADVIKAGTDYGTPPLPKQDKRRIYLPKGVRRK